MDFDRTMGYHLWASIELVRMGVDIMWWGEDIANEEGPNIHSDLYRAILKPRQAHMIQEVRRVNKNVKIAFHSDGEIGWALDDLVEIGFDIINPLQPDVNDTVEGKRRYGKSLTIWRNVDTRHVMSKGSCSDVVEEVRKVIRTLAPGGGLILCSNHQICRLRGQ